MTVQPNVPAVLAKAHELKKTQQLEQAIALLETANLAVRHTSVAKVLANFLMDNHQYQRVTEIDNIKQLDPYNYTLAKSFVGYELSTPVAVCPTNTRPLEKAAFVAIVKDEQDIIFFNLLWHYTLGFRKFFIINNLSTDNTLKLIRAFEKIFSDAEVFVLHDPVVAHYQGKKTTGACRFALSIWSDLEWIALVDGDEFLCPKQPLDDFFNAVPKNIDAIIVAKSFYNLIPGERERNNAFFFRRMKHRTPITHVSAKIIMRANLDFNVSQGNHHLFTKENKEVENYYCNLDLIYREFRIRSCTQHKSKFINLGKAKLSARQQGFMHAGGEIKEKIYAQYLELGEAALHKHFYNKIKNALRTTTVLDPLPMDDLIKTTLQYLIDTEQPSSARQLKQTLRLITSHFEK